MGIDKALGDRSTKWSKSIYAARVGELKELVKAIIEKALRPSPQRCKSSFDPILVWLPKRAIAFKDAIALAYA
ncbi:MAG: hypothetical protein LH679_02460 [Cyanobacteria bacterium CAN_BIN43]|nr:hypothetical protein [Cyanobacteria bacterium CAN_BIN43]